VLRREPKRLRGGSGGKIGEKVEAHFEGGNVEKKGKKVGKGWSMLGKGKQMQGPLFPRPIRTCHLGDTQKTSPRVLGLKFLRFT